MSLMPILALFDSVMVAGRTPLNARSRPPKRKKEEEVTPVRMARPNGSATRWTSCWVRVPAGWTTAAIMALVGWEVERRVGRKSTRV